MAVEVPAARMVFAPEDRARILAMVDRSLESGSLTLGGCTRDFEAAFAACHSAVHAVATSSGTSALEIILRATGLAGGEVVVPANTFYASAAAVLHAGGRVRFADVDASTLALSEATVTAVLTADTVAVMVVHIGGSISPEVPAIRRLCDRRGLLLIEDAAHAHGSTLDGMPAGGFGHAAAFSFYPTKVITSGEGGMIVTADGNLAAEARIYRDQGKGSFLGGGHIRLGAAWRMSELHAAVGRVHLDHLDQFIAVRTDVARRYDAGLIGRSGLSALTRPPGSSSNYYKYPVLLAAGIDRAEVKRRMAAEHKVTCSGEVYATPLHWEPVFASRNDVSVPADLAVAEDTCSRQLCLPVHSDMTTAEVDQVLAAVIEVVGSC